MNDWFTAEQRERLRIQELLLKEIYSINGSPLFKGGTALEIAYGLDRFSEDLDFDMDEKDITIIDAAIENLDSRVMSVENDWEAEIIRHSNMHVFVLDFFSAQLNSRVSIKIDAVFERHMLEPKKKLIEVSGFPVVLNVMAEREILAEKVNAIMNTARNQPRDLYDLRFLLMAGTPIDLHLVYQKSGRRTFGDVQKYSFGAFAERIGSMVGRWAELEPYVMALPRFTEVRDYVLGAFRLMG